MLVLVLEREWCRLCQLTVLTCWAGMQPGTAPIVGKEYSRCTGYALLRSVTFLQRMSRVLSATFVAACPALPATVKQA